MITVENQKSEIRNQKSSGLSVAFVVGCLHTEASGVGRIVCDLANALGDGGTKVTAYSVHCRGMQPARHMLRPPGRFRAVPGRWMGRLAYSPELRRELLAEGAGIDVFHNHSLWTLPNRYASAAARRHGKPVVFTAMGFLEPWAMARSRWKKRLVGAWFQNADLRRAACIQVNSTLEARSVRAYGLKNPVAVIPNGVDPAHFANLPARDAFEERCPEVRGKRVCLFLSRLHEKKGLGHLVEAWRRMEREHADWQLVIAGPDDGYEAAVRGMVADFGLGRRVTLAGPLFGPDKLAALAAAEVFALPTFSEGFPMAVLEALACRLPVLLTPGCNFPEVARAGAGLEVEPNADETERGLRALLGASEAERAAMGRHARQLIEAGYTWEKVAEKMLALYGWLLGGGTKPECVGEGEASPG